MRLSCVYDLVVSTVRRIIATRISRLVQFAGLSSVAESSTGARSAATMIVCSVNNFCEVRSFSAHCSRTSQVELSCDSWEGLTACIEGPVRTRVAISSQRRGSPIWLGVAHSGLIRRIEGILNQPDIESSDLYIIPPDYWVLNYISNLAVFHNWRKTTGII